MVLMLEDISRCWKIEAGKCPADNVSCILCFQKMKNCKLLKAAWDKHGCHFSGWNYPDRRKAGKVIAGRRVPPE